MHQISNICLNEIVHNTKQYVFESYLHLRSSQLYSWTNILWVHLFPSAVCLCTVANRLHCKFVQTVHLLLCLFGLKTGMFVQCLFGQKTGMFVQSKTQRVQFNVCRWCFLWTPYLSPIICHKWKCSLLWIHENEWSVPHLDMERLANCSKIFVQFFPCPC